MYWTIISWGLLFAVSNVVKSEFYSSVSDLNKLLQTEGIILKQLDSYIQAQEERLGELRRRTLSWKSAHGKATRNAKDYLLNPVNAFLLIKRLTLEWNDIEVIANDMAKQDLMNTDDAGKKTLALPERVDLLGAMDALLRLQDVYNLDASAIANGIGTGSKMLADDCFELGQKLQETGDTHHAADWFREAYDRFDLGKIDLNKKVKILEYLASYSYTTGNVEDALDYTDYLLDLQPDNKKALGQKTFYEDAIWDQQDKLFKSDKISSSKASNNILAVYKKLCQGEILRNASETSHLRCRYTSTLSAFSKIAPFKIEEINLNPRIVVFHDVLSDTEIDLLKNWSKPLLSRAGIANQETGKGEVSNYRVSKSTWFTDDYHAAIETITERVEDMTGLSMDTAEELQVVNYGLGGQYGPHFDFFHWGELTKSNRIATVLFYMSDVKVGGATVFPKLNFALEARKGSAAFWYNLHSSGNLDYSTLHGACPVLIGEKWVANKWIRERGQEFRRKCDPHDME
uniref:procollagen-proline 4-dioxygenase n=1 Tax=Aedes albopictus TaxID=7160 RepID=A0A023EW59_AEDAL